MNFQQVLSDPARREHIARDCVRLIEDEVADKRGLSGMALRTGFAAFQRIQPGIVRRAVDHLLPELGRALEPHWAAAPRAEAFAARASAVANDLLAVTDQLATRGRSAVLTQLYRTLRPAAHDHVSAAVPRLGRLLQVHLGGPARSAESV